MRPKISMSASSPTRRALEPSGTDHRIAWSVRPYAARQTTEDDRLSYHAMKRPGHLKIYLGYAAGVGKTYRMLEEAQALRAQGVDVVIGYFEPHGRSETVARSEGLEFVPRRVIDYAGSRFEEMDTEAILRRKPKLAVVD